MVATLIIFLGGLILLILIGIPVAFAIGNMSILSFIIERGFGGIPYEVVAQRMLYGVKSFPLLAVPFFIFAGKVMNVGGITNRIFKFAGHLVGFLPGGLAHANVIASMLFAGMSGSSVADAAGLGAVEIKAMDEAGYDHDITIGVTAASSCIGPIIPPSTVFVIYAVSANESVSKLLIAGLLPGIMMGLSLMIFTLVIASTRKTFPSHSFSSFNEIWLSFKDAVFSLLTPIIILGGILGGIFTPTEAAAIASLYSLILSVLVYRKLSFRDILDIAKEVARHVGVLLLIFAAANLYGWVLIRQRIPYYLAEILLTVTENPLVILLILNVFFIIVGCFMSATVSIIIFTPIIVPIISKFGIDPLHFGVVMVYVLSIGVITPPFGQVLFVLTRITRDDFGFIVRSVLPWYIPLIFGMIIVSYFPIISTWLPSILLK